MTIGPWEIQTHLIGQRASREIRLIPADSRGLLYRSYALPIGWLGELHQINGNEFFPRTVARSFQICYTARRHITFASLSSGRSLVCSTCQPAVGVAT